MVSPLYAEKYYYVYKDSSGRTHIEDSISSDHAKYGYRVVNSQGATIEVVPSTREKKRKEAKRREQARRAIERREERQADEFLLQSFVSVEDIREAGNKKILAIQSQIDITKRHIDAFEKNLEQLEAQIERDDLNGKDVTQQQIDDIQRIKDSIEQNKKFIIRKVEQQREIREQYLEYIERFKQLRASK